MQMFYFVHYGTIISLIYKLKKHGTVFYVEFLKSKLNSLKMLFVTNKLLQLVH